MFHDMFVYESGLRREPGHQKWVVCAPANTHLLFVISFNARCCSTSPPPGRPLSAPSAGLLAAGAAVSDGLEGAFGFVGGARG
jgi:hypothetical protein